MKPFFILSLPRSRTAWMANFLTYKDSFCFHEALLERPTIHGLREVMENTGKETVGNSDSGNLFFIDELKYEFPEAKYIVIHRDIPSVYESLKGIGVPIARGELELANDELLWASKNYGIPSYQFDELTKENCKKIWEYITETEFDPLRWELLNNLRVEVNMNFVHEKLMRTADNFRSLMGVH